MNLFRRMLLTKWTSTVAFNPFGSWEDVQSTLNRAGWAWKNIIGQDRELVLKAGIVLKGGSPSVTGIGITFPASQVPSTDVNTLDDYEEGVWTPALTFGGGATGLTYATQLGRYVKIGRFVQVWFRITLSAKGTSTGAAVIGGLPFSVNSATGGEIGLVDWFNHTASLVNMKGQAAGSEITLTRLTAAATSWANADDTDFSNSSTIAGCIPYGD